MAEFTFRQMMQTGHVKRWQIVRTAREQTIAEHMYRVWVVTQFICKQLKIDEHVAEVASTWALIHDLPEVVTGDIATPAKEAMRKAVPEGDPIKNIELRLSDSYRQVWAVSKNENPGQPTANEIVKLADLIEAKCFMGCEALGWHADEVTNTMRDNVDRYMEKMIEAYPAVEWSNLEEVFNTECV